MKSFISVLFIVISINYAQNYFLLTNAEKKYIEYNSLKYRDINHPLSQPYTDLQINNTVSHDSTIWRQNINYLINKTKYQFNLGTTINGSAGKKYFSNSNELGSNIYGFYKANYLTVLLNYRTDSEYQKDNTYFGSIGKFDSKVVGRITDSFIEYHKDKFKIFFGRKI